MKVIKVEEKMCFICMKTHPVETVETIDRCIHDDDTLVAFNVNLDYCQEADEYLVNEELINFNSKSHKEAYDNIIKMNKNHKQKIYIENKEDEVISKTLEECPLCLAIHEVELIKAMDSDIYKNTIVPFEIMLKYCSNEDDYFEDEELMGKNSLSYVKSYESILEINNK